MGGDLRWQRPAAMHWQQDRRCAEKAREPTGLANVPPHAYVAWEYLRSLVRYAPSRALRRRWLSEWKPVGAGAW